MAARPRRHADAARSGRRARARAGDLVCFLAGPDGAHKVTNRSDAVVADPDALDEAETDVSICVYPDSDKVGVWPPGGRYRMSDALGYWDGEI